MKRKSPTVKQKRVRIAITCILFFTISQTAFGAGNQAEENHAPGLHKTGLAGELLITTAETITTQSEDAAVPKPLLAAEELLPPTVTFPSHLVTEFVSPPTGTQTVTPDGDEVISLYLHVQRGGDMFPVMLIRVDSTDQEALVYAPAPPPIELSQGLGSMVDETRQQAIEQAYTAPVGGPDVRWASYIPTVIHDHAALAIVIPKPDHTTLFGVLWHSDSATMYVGGYLPYKDIQAIAEAFSH